MAHMLIAVSDLHLADAHDHYSIDIKGFLARINLICENARSRGVNSVTLLLLGDIFELLRSKVWLDHQLRPWEESTPAHRAVVTRIFDGIVDTNDDFFAGLRDLAVRHEIDIEYVPGNHDLAINGEMGGDARSKLRAILGLKDCGQGQFHEIYLNDRHSVLARHGHEWDEPNRSGNSGNPIGEAVVIDLVLKIPLLAEERLPGVDLWFLSQLDSVRPQTPLALQQWIHFGMADLSDRSSAEQALIRKTIDDCLAEALEGFFATLETGRFASWRRHSVFSRMGFRALFKTAKHVGLTNFIRTLPYEHDREKSIRQYALRDLRQTRKYRFVLCGHTHHSELVPLDAGFSPESPVYFNTGSWHRVYRRAYQHSAGNSLATFSGWDEECMVTIYSEEEQMRLAVPSFDYFRVNRGISTNPNRRK
jgi:UDP-2,3-diacylglucosamine pyrophosphatase LpxH